MKNFGYAESGNLNSMTFILSVELSLRHAASRNDSPTSSISSALGFLDEDRCRLLKPISQTIFEFMTEISWK